MKLNRSNFRTKADKSPPIKQFGAFQLLAMVLLLISFACSTEKTSDEPDEEEIQIPFNKKKWRNRKGADYPYRDQMVHDILYTDTVRALGKAEILELLGEPNRINEGHLYYLVAEKRMGF
jgi:hypothetical protein